MNAFELLDSPIPEDAVSAGQAARFLRCGREKISRLVRNGVLRGWLVPSCTGKKRTLKVAMSQVKELILEVVPAKGPERAPDPPSQTKARRQRTEKILREWGLWKEKEVQG